MLSRGIILENQLMKSPGNIPCLSFSKWKQQGKTCFLFFWSLIISLSPFLNQRSKNNEDALSSQCKETIYCLERGYTRSSLEQGFINLPGTRIVQRVYIIVYFCLRCLFTWLSIEFTIWSFIEMTILFSTFDDYLDKKSEKKPSMRSLKYSRKQFLGWAINTNKE